MIEGFKLQKKGIIRILVVGFGRMGVSHALQMMGNLKAFSYNVEIHVCDNSFISRCFARFICPDVKFITFGKLNSLPANHFDVAVDSTPPFSREVTVPLLERVAKRLLVEKPTVVTLSRESMSGYVLQHNPLVPHLVAYCMDRRFVEARVLTNVGFNSRGWRTGSFGGVSSEYLGHALSIPLSVFPGQAKAEVTALDMFEQTIKASIQFSSITVNVHLEFGRTDVRKASYDWRFRESSNFSDESKSILFDLYQIKAAYRDEVTSLKSIASEGVSVPYYLRGFDFALQNCALINGSGDVFSPKDLELIERCVREISSIENENRSR